MKLREYFVRKEKITTLFNDFFSSGSVFAVIQSRVRKLSDFIKNILICVPKMNEGLTSLEKTWGWVINEFSFLGELSL